MTGFKMARAARAAAWVATFAAAWGAGARAQEEAPLPRWREGGTPYDAAQSLLPRALHAPQQVAPTSGLIASPPEYSPARGVLFRYNSASYASVVRDCVVALTADPAHDEIAYVVVSSASQQSSATSAFVAGGADMSKVQFILQPTDSVWLRDYGPHFIWQGGALGLVDSQYYPTRPLDNFIPTLVGDENFGMPTYDMGVYYSGGNFQPGPGRTGFATALVNTDNPASGGFDPALLAEFYQRFQGIDTLHVMPQLPTSVDGTGHIDMWMYLVDQDDVIISQFKAGSNATAIQITDNAVPYMQALGFRVTRPWAWNSGGTHYTYTNAFRVNDRIFVPIYGPGNPAYAADDQDALAKWQTAAGPGVQIVPINCYSIIPAAGAIHCIVMQVPRYTAAVPAAHVISPAGGELLAPGTTHTVAWVATDTNNVTIPTVDLYWSPDAGRSWQWIATTTNSGSYAWTVPNTPTDLALFKVRVTAVDGDVAEAVGAASFRVAPAQRAAYDFATGAGVTRSGWGYQTSSWSNLDSVRLPVAGALTAANYAALATSNATGGITDTNRYICPTVSTGSEATHVFEFTIAEPAAEVDDLELVWEGYADRCTQVELYLWDHVAGRWGDGAGRVGQNRYLDSWAGNRDGRLGGHVRSGFDRVIGPGGQVTVLVYAQRSADETVHDYMALTVTRVSETGAAFCSGDGSAAACPCGNSGAPGHGCASSVAAEGARLMASGTASLAADTLRLAASGLPPSAALVFLQGSAAQSGGAGQAFGDGLRCAGGAVVRLAQRTATAGAVSYGQPGGDVPVSVRGAIPAGGGTYHYQAWYRDVGSFCTSAAYNLSNGWTVVWAP
jgi:agmatine/peptidylarginine deiminase